VIEPSESWDRADPAPRDDVVLLDASRRPIGSMARDLVHTTDTPLHLAFSCWVLDAEHRVLMTRRAVTKRTWPGVWSNACCGHPRPGEAVADAVVRRVDEELGLRVRELALAVPHFAYRAVDASGIVEHEVCPVHVARVDADPSPDPSEVAEWRWVAWDDVVTIAATAPWALSPWSVLQISELVAAGGLGRSRHENGGDAPL
jgi:isopentenyl-diphosphate delta-isomerase